MGKITITKGPQSSTPTAADVSFDNSGGELTAITVQEAIEEIDHSIGTRKVTYESTIHESKESVIRKRLILSDRLTIKGRLTIL